MKPTEIVDNLDTRMWEKFGRRVTTVGGWRGLGAGAAVGIVIVFQMALTYVTPMQKLFGTEAIRFASWMRIAAVSSSVLFLVEFEKFVFRKYPAAKKKLSLS